MKTASPAGEVRKHDADVYRAGEYASAQTSDSLGRDLGKIDWRDNSSLSNAQAHDKASSVHLSQPAVVGQEDYHAEDPEKTQLARSPETTNAIRKDESQESTADTADLDHCGDIAFHVGVSIVVEFIEAEKVLEMFCVEGA
jgi:hypothetical protein